MLPSRLRIDSIADSYLAMQLKLTLSSIQAQSLGSEASVFFRLRGGTIGRTRDNDWILPDPERIISGHHARILYDRGGYFVEDTSTNGTFLNQNDMPLPRGQPAALSHGDTLYIGEYEIQVELVEEQPHFSVPGSNGDSARPTDADFIPKPYRPEADASADNRPADSWAAAPPGEADHWPEHQRAPTAESQRSEDEAASHGDHLAADRQHFRPPEAAPELIAEDVPPPIQETLPDDWWSSGEEPAVPAEPERPFERATPEPVPASQPPAPPVAEPRASVVPDSQSPSDEDESPVESQQLPVAGVMASPPEHQPEPEPERNRIPQPIEPQALSVEGSIVTGQLDEAFFAGLGIDPAGVSPAQREVLLRQLGRLIRLLTQGMIEVLQARSTLKGEFRLSQTVVRPAENNPLKFSLGADQALQQFFVERRPGFMGAEAAFAEALKDIKQHEIAVVAGMRAAFDCLLRKLAPEAVEAALRAGGKRSSKIFGDKSWDFYKTYYAEFKANAGDDFQGIFGEDFVRAYEEQVAQLAARERDR